MAEVPVRLRVQRIGEPLDRMGDVADHLDLREVHGVHLGRGEIDMDHRDAPLRRDGTPRAPASGSSAPKPIGACTWSTAASCRPNVDQLEQILRTPSASRAFTNNAAAFMPRLRIKSVQDASRGVQFPCRSALVDSQRQFAIGKTRAQARVHRDALRRAQHLAVRIEQDRVATLERGQRADRVQRMAGMAQRRLPAFEEVRDRAAQTLDRKSGV